MIVYTKYPEILFMLCVFFLAGCSHDIIKQDNKNINSTGKRNVWRNNNIAPGHCRIAGTIVSIDSTLDKSSAKDPCSRKPCNAVVRVDSILGYGSAFPPLLTGNLIQIHFYFTLSATTKDLFPNMTEFYPGLTVGSSFIGDIEMVIRLNENNKTNRYAIYGYRQN